MTKTEMTTEIRTLPQGYQEHIDKELPALPDAPADVDAANIACGRLALYLLDLFASFEGLQPLKIPAHMGQLNEVVIGMMLGGLEVNPDAADFQIVEPPEGATYPVTGEDIIVPLVFQVTIGADNVSSYMATVTDPNSETSVIDDFEVSNDTYSTTVTCNLAGTWMFVVSVSFKDDTIILSKSRTIEVM